MSWEWLCPQKDCEQYCTQKQQQQSNPLQQLLVSVCCSLIVLAVVRFSAFIGPPFWTLVTTVFGWFWTAVSKFTSIVLAILACVTIYGFVLLYRSWNQIQVIDPRQLLSSLNILNNNKP